MALTTSWRHDIPPNTRHFKSSTPSCRLDSILHQSQPLPSRLLHPGIVYYSNISFLCSLTFLLTCLCPLSLPFLTSLSCTTYFFLHVHPCFYVYTLPISSSFSSWLLPFSSLLPTLPNKLPYTRLLSFFILRDPYFLCVFNKALHFQFPFCLTLFISLTRPTLLSRFTLPRFSPSPGIVSLHSHPIFHPNAPWPPFLSLSFILRPPYTLPGLLLRLFDLSHSLIHGTYIFNHKHIIVRTPL